MSACDITEFRRTAYRPFAYCVPSKKTEICVSKGVSSSRIGLSSTYLNFKTQRIDTIDLYKA